MGSFHSTPRWRSASLNARVREWTCRVCGLQPSRPDQLHAAHLMSVFELHRDFPRDRAALTDPDNLVALCRSDHAALDYLLCHVRDARLLAPSYRGKLWKRVERSLPAFVALLGARARYRARLRAAHAKAIAS